MGLGVGVKLGLGVLDGWLRFVDGVLRERVEGEVGAVGMEEEYWVEVRVLGCCQGSRLEANKAIMSVFLQDLVLLGLQFTKCYVICVKYWYSPQSLLVGFFLFGLMVNIKKLHSTRFYTLGVDYISVVICWRCYRMVCYAAMVVEDILWICYTLYQISNDY